MHHRVYIFSNLHSKLPIFILKQDKYLKFNIPVFRYFTGILRKNIILWKNKICFKSFSVLACFLQITGFSVLNRYFDIKLLEYFCGQNPF